VGHYCRRHQNSSWWFNSMVYSNIKGTCVPSQAVQRNRLRLLVLGSVWCTSEPWIQLQVGYTFSGRIFCSPCHSIICQSAIRVFCVILTANVVYYVSFAFEPHPSACVVLETTRGKIGILFCYCSLFFGFVGSDLLVVYLCCFQTSLSRSCAFQYTYTCTYTYIIWIQGNPRIFQ
jgi:hypothetical protein